MTFKNKGVCRSRVVTFAAIRLQSSRFKPWPGQKFETRFLQVHAHTWSASGTTTSGTRASPKPGNSPKKVSKWRVDGWVQIHQSLRRNMNEIQMAGEEEWMEKTQRYGRQKGKGDRHQHGRKPRILDSRNSLETQLVRKWGDIGHLWALSPWGNGWMEAVKRHSALITKIKFKTCQSQFDFLYAKN